MRASEVLGRGCIRQNEKDKGTFCSACMCCGLILTFCMDEEVCLLLCMEGSLFCFRKMTMDVDIGLRSRDVVTIHGVCDNVTVFSKLGTLLRRS